MLTETPAYVSNMEGKSALPRKNGELVFQEPWEGKIFAIAVALSQKGLFAWNDFREKLTDEITYAEARDSEHETEMYYYQHWQKALETLLIEKNVVSPEQLELVLDHLRNCKSDHH